MLRAIIFDFDGVLVDTEALHFESLKSTLAQHDITIDEAEYYDRYLGFADRECAERALADRGRPATTGLVEAIVATKLDIFSRIRGTIQLFPGVGDFVRQAAGRYPLAIASGSFRGDIESTLEAVSLRTYFTGIASAEDAPHGKPDPTVFRAALAALNGSGGAGGMQPDECVVIEDTIPGVDGALRAGMRCVAVTNSRRASELQRAHLVVPGLDQLDLSRLEALC
jgi:beta-phosphoglucomutase